VIITKSCNHLSSPCPDIRAHVFIQHSYLIYFSSWDNLNKLSQETIMPHVTLSPPLLSDLPSMLCSKRLTDWISWRLISPDLSVLQTSCFLRPDLLYKGNKVAAIAEFFSQDCQDCSVISARAPALSGDVASWELNIERDKTACKQWKNSLAGSEMKSVMNGII